MNRNTSILSLAVIFLGLALAISAIVINEENSTSETTIFVSPLSISVEVDQTFEVGVNVSGVSDLYGCEFKLGYNTSLLELINIAEGSFLNSNRDTYFVPKVMGTDGYVLAGCTLLRNVAGVSGNGTLATVEFRAKKEGTCTLDLYDTKLVNSAKQLVEHNEVDGAVTVEKHDIAVVNIIVFKTIIGQGYSASINVTVENQGGYTETFNVTVYANATIINTLTDITLTSGNSTTITFTWNTSDFVKGNCTISANITQVLGETDTTDNMLINGVVLVGVPCDVTGPEPGVPDGVCNMRDIGYFCSKFGTTPSNPNWDPNCDVTGPTPRTPDNIVNMRDIGEACNNFMKT